MPKRIAELAIKRIELTTQTIKPGVGSKVPTNVYNGGGVASGVFYLEDGTAIEFSAPIQNTEAREFMGLFLRVASRLYSDLGGE